MSSGFYIYITSKFEWTLNDIRIEKIILVQLSDTFFFFFFFFEVLALLDVRYCPKLQSGALSRKTNDVTLRKWQKSSFQIQFGAPEIFFHGVLPLLVV